MSEASPTDQQVQDPIIPKLESLVDHLNRTAQQREARQVYDAILVIDELTRRLEVMREDLRTLHAGGMFP